MERSLQSALWGYYLIQELCDISPLTGTFGINTSWDIPYMRLDAIKRIRATAEDRILCAQQMHEMMPLLIQKCPELITEPYFIDVRLMEMRKKLRCDILLSDMPGSKSRSSPTYQEIPRFCFSFHTHPAPPIPRLEFAVDKDDIDVWEHLFAENASKVYNDMKADIHDLYNTTDWKLAGTILVQHLANIIRNRCLFAPSLMQDLARKWFQDYSTTYCYIGRGRQGAPEVSQVIPSVIPNFLDTDFPDPCTINAKSRDETSRAVIMDPDGAGLSFQIIHSKMYTDDEALDCFDLVIELLISRASITALKEIDFF